MNNITMANEIWLKAQNTMHYDKLKYCTQIIICFLIFPLKRLLNIKGI